jgi:hypothetical protein
LLTRAIDAEIELMPRIKAKTIDGRLYINRGDCYHAVGDAGHAVRDYQAAKRQHNVDEADVSLMYVQFCVDSLTRALDHRR